MTHPIFPCFWFDGTAAEAAGFYAKVLPDTQLLSSNQAVTTIAVFGKQLMLLNGGPQYSINPSVSLFVLCTTEDEINTLWGQLSEGGSALIPLDRYPWSERYGWVKDRFGITWQLMLSADAAEKDKLRPCMLFTGSNFGKAAEAMAWYTNVFDRSAVTDRIPNPDNSEFAGTTQYAEFHLNGYPMIAMDGPGEHAYGFDPGVSFVVTCDTQEEIDHYWNALTERGTASMCGWLSDQYGVSWQIVPSVLQTLMNDPEKGPRVIAAFMQMEKFIIADLLNA